MGLRTNAARLRLPRLLHYPYTNNNYARNSVGNRCIDSHEDLMNDSDDLFLSQGQYTRRANDAIRVSANTETT